MKGTCYGWMSMAIGEGACYGRCRCYFQGGENEGYVLLVDVDVIFPSSMRTPGDQG